MARLKQAGGIVLLLGMAGLALCIWLFVRHGFHDVYSAVIAAGWGVGAVIAFHVVPLVCDTTSWRAVLPPKDRLSLWRLVGIRWIGDSVSAMLPVAQVGGEVVRVRLASLNGMRMPIAVASVLVGITVSVFTQIIFTLTGLALMLGLSGHTNLTRPVLLGSLLGVLAAVGFYYFQRVGMFRLGAVIISHFKKSSGWAGLIKSGEELDGEIRTVYAQPRAVLKCSFWNMATWLTGAVEVYIALHALGIHASYSQAYVLESMSQGIRSAAFLIPGALGVQEGGFLLVGGLLGIPAETAMSLALIRRVREVAFGVPGVIAWQSVEWRHYLAQGRMPSQGVFATPASGLDQR